MKRDELQTPSFYKALVINVGFYESTIVDERHFADDVSAQSFKDEQEHDNYKCVIFHLSN